MSGGRPSPQQLLEGDIDELDNVVTARDKLILYNMLALPKDISVDWSLPRDSVLGRVYQAKWLTAPVDIACLEIDIEHLYIRPQALGALINTTLTLRKAMGSINQLYFSGQPYDPPGDQQIPPETATSMPDEWQDVNPESAREYTKKTASCRAHIQELLAVQLEPQLSIITGTLTNCVSLHQLILDGKGTWSWRDRIEMLLQVSQGMVALHDQNIVHGNLRLSNIQLNLETNRIVIAGTAWDQLLPFDLLNVHQADEPGSIRWTAPECYDYITKYASQQYLAHPPTPPATVGPVAFSPRSRRRLKPHPPRHRPACDVYAFAMTFWELANCTGELPYSTVKSAREVMSFISSNNRMFLPPAWPSDVRELISLCWSGDFTKRPSFTVVTQALSCIMLQQVGSSRKAKSSHPEEF